MRHALRLRLTLLTAALLCLALALGAVALTTVLSRSRVAALDAILRTRVDTVIDLVDQDRVPPALPVGEPGEIVQVLDAEGAVLATSTNASRTLPVLPPTEVAALGERAGTGPVSHRSAYDGEARVAVRPASYRGAPVTVVATMPLGEVRALLDALRVALVGVVPVLTALLALTIWLVLGRALAPVEELRRAAAQVAREGGPGSLPVPRGSDELSALARTLNEMLDRLETAAARQRTFVADAAHELRSPVAAMRTEIEVARAHPDAYPAGELAADLEGEVLRMQGLVDDLLLLARVGSAPTGTEELDLVAVVQRALTGARPAPGVDVDVAGTGRAVGNPTGVERVVRNLLDNALRHARSRVLVQVREGGVVVADDGGGIPPADRERVFERFVRLEDARDREAGGAGLGLAIAREVARDHGGDVTLGGSDLGGLAAELTLPALSRPPQPAVGARPRPGPPAP